MGILGAAVGQHVDIVAVNGGRCSQQMMLQLLLGHVVQDVCQTAVGLDVALGNCLVDDGLGVAGIILNQTQDVGLVNIADFHSLHLGDHDLDVIPQQGVAVVGTDFGCGVGVVLQALDEHDALAVCTGHRDEVGCLSLVGGMAGDVVDALSLVQLCDDEVVVGVVMDDELNIVKVTLAVGEQLGQLDAVGEHMGVIHQGIVVAGVGTLPGQDDLVGVACIAKGDGVVGIHGGLVGDPQGAVGEAGVDHGSISIDSIGGVDHCQTLLGHFDGHDGLTVSGGTVGDGEEAVGFLPGGDPVGAVLIDKELQHYIILIVGQALAQGIDERVAAQVGGLGGDAGQSGNDLVVDDVTGRSGAGMGVAVGDVGGGAVVLAGVGDLLTEGLLQLRDAGQVLGEGSHIVDPAGAAVGGIGTIDGGHGQGDQEGVDGGDDHLRNSGFHAQVQAQIQVEGLGLAVGIGQRHLHAAVVSHVVFQRILDGGGVGFQTVGQGVDQRVRLVEILGSIQLVCIGVTFRAVIQAQSLQEVCPLVLVDAVEDFHVAVGAAVFCGLRELDDIGDLQVAEFYALDGIAIAVLTVAQVVGVVGVAVTVGAHEGLIHLLIIHAGGDIAGVPDAVLLGIAQVHLIEGQRTLPVKVDGCIRDACRRNTDGETQTGQQSQTTCDCFRKLFHFSSNLS